MSDREINAMSKRLKAVFDSYPLPLSLEGLSVLHALALVAATLEWSRTGPTGGHAVRMKFARAWRDGMSKELGNPPDIQALGARVGALERYINATTTPHGWGRWAAAYLACWNRELDRRRAAAPAGD